MKAWVKRGSGLQFEETAPPLPAPGSVVVEVKAISLNRGEVRTAARAAEGTIAGWDVAGVVVEADPRGYGPRAGSPVAAITTGGAWAERVSVPVSHAAVIPEGVGFAAASTLPVAGLTVMRSFAIAGSLAGRSLLVTGASGGVGQYAIQLGALAGAEVTAISSRGDQRDSLLRLGAREVIASIGEAAGRWDLILESVGGSSLAAAIEGVAPAGVVVSIGNSSEQETTFNARTLYGKGAARIYGLMIFEEVASGRTGGADLERLLRLLAQGKLQAPVSLTRPWTELPAVLAELEKRSFAGKAVLTR